MAKDWLARMNRYVYPVIGGEPVADVDGMMIKSILCPVAEKRALCKNLAQQIGGVLDYAIAHDLRDAANKATVVYQQLPKCNKTVEHHKAVPWRDVPAAITAVNATGITPAAKDAAMILILTAARTSEVLGMTWGEIDGDTWVIPAERMKAKRRHRVPLSIQAQAILDARRERSGIPR